MEKHDLGQFIAKAKRELLLDDEFVLKLLDQKNPGDEVSFLSLCRLSEFLGVSISNIVDDNVDFNIVRKNYISPSTSIHEKYLATQGTYMSNIRPAFGIVQELYNHQIAIDMFNRFQINSSVLYSDNIVTNNLLTNDIFQHMKEILKFTDSQMYLFTMRTFDKEKKRGVSRLYKNVKSDFDMLLQTSKNMEFFERNFHYSCQRTDKNHFVLKSVSNEEVNEELKTAFIASRHTVDCKYKMLQTINYLIARKPLKLIAIKDNINNGRQFVDYIFKETIF